MTRSRSRAARMRARDHERVVLALPAADVERVAVGHTGVSLAIGTLPRVEQVGAVRDHDRVGVVPDAVVGLDLVGVGDQHASEPHATATPPSGTRSGQRRPTSSAATPARRRSGRPGDGTAAAAAGRGRWRRCTARRPAATGQRPDAGPTERVYDGVEVLALIVGSVTSGSPATGWPPWRSASGSRPSWRSPGRPAAARAARRTSRSRRSWPGSPASPGSPRRAACGRGTGRAFAPRRGAMPATRAAAARRGASRCWRPAARVRRTGGRRGRRPPSLTGWAPGARPDLAAPGGRTRPSSRSAMTCSTTSSGRQRPREEFRRRGRGRPARASGHREPLCCVVVPEDGVALQPEPERHQGPSAAPQDRSRIMSADRSSPRTTSPIQARERSPASSRVFTTRSPPRRQGGGERRLEVRRARAQGAPPVQPRARATAT